MVRLVAFFPHSALEAYQLNSLLLPIHSSLHYSTYADKWKNEGPLFKRTESLLTHHPEKRKKDKNKGLHQSLSHAHACTVSFQKALEHTLEYEGTAKDDTDLKKAFQKINRPKQQQTKKKSQRNQKQCKAQKNISKKL